MVQVALLENPSHRYAEEFIRLLADEMGLLTIALWTAPDSRRRYGGRYPVLRSGRVRAEYAVGSASPEAVVAALRSDGFEAAAVIPFVETAVATAGELARAAGLSWGRASDWSMFRNKFAVKSRLASGSVRINRFALVSDADAVLAELGGGVWDRFVLKPNDGFGNSRIAVMEPGVSRSELDTYFAAVGGDVLMEEFVVGREFFINGQADEAGEPHVLLVGRYLREPHNGRHNIEVGVVALRSSDPRFAVLADYARDLVRVLGMRRTPFFAEVMLTDDGPCLIEVAARLVGGGNAFTTRRAHRGRIDPFELAAHFYVDDSPVPINPDWEYQDSQVIAEVAGASDVQGRLWSGPRMDEVEQLPEFVAWLEKPRLGQKIKRTVDVGSCSYRLEIRPATEADLPRVSEQVKELMRFNPPGHGLSRVPQVAKALASGTVARASDVGIFPRRLRIIHGETVEEAAS